MSAIGCQSQNCPFRFRRGVYHCGPCHCLDDIPIEKRAQLRRWIYDMRDADAHTISRMGRELAAARAERDARPAITPDDCAIRDEYIRAPDDKIRPYMTGAVARIDVALSAHGKKARIYPCEKCGKMRSEDEGGAEFRYCDTCRVVAKAAKP